MAAKAVGVGVTMPPVSILERNHIMLLGALLPAQTATTCGLPPSLALRFLAALHRAHAISVAELLRHREQLMATSRAAEGGQGPVQAEQHAPVVPCALPIERQL